MKNYITEAKQSFLDRNIDPIEKWWGVYSYVNRIRVDWNLSEETITVAYGNSPRDREVIKEYLEECGYEVTYARSKRWLVIQPDIKVFGEVITSIDDLSIELETPQGSERKKEVGATFEGTQFSKIKERGATIGGKFGAMVCEAGGMNMKELYAEEYYSCGEIDGVEKDPNTNKPITIYECQSGIHHGAFLDDLHLDKATRKYLYDKEILPTVKKIVILAGGYSANTIRSIRERAYELSLRERPIEIVLLKTERIKDTISIVKVDYAST